MLKIMGSENIVFFLGGKIRKVYVRDSEVFLL